MAKVDSMNDYEIVIRVKLPSAVGFHSSPSGDTEYEEAYRKAIFDKKPVGFEVRWPRLNEKWPVDGDGMTWVPLYVSDKAAVDPVPKLLERLNAMRRLIERLKNSVATVVGDVECLERV